MLFDGLLRLGLFLSAAVIAGVQPTANFVLAGIDVVSFAHAAGGIKFRASHRLGYPLSVIGYRLSAIGYRLSAIGYRAQSAAILNRPPNEFPRQAQSRTT